MRRIEFNASKDEKKDIYYPLSKLKKESFYNQFGEQLKEFIIPVKDQIYEVLVNYINQKGHFNLIEVKTNDGSYIIFRI